MNKTLGFSVTILGNSSAIPSQNHHPASQVVVYENQYFLIDCGEGTQIQLIKYKIKYHKIDHIFISHMHGDHFFGLIGLISTYHLLGRKRALNIYGPVNLKQIIERLLDAAYTKLKFDLIFHSLKTIINLCYLKTKTVGFIHFLLITEYRPGALFLKKIRNSFE